MIKTINSVINNQKEFFKEGHTLNIKYRIEALKRLYKNIINNMSLINNAIYKDLGKSASEAYMCEIGMVLNSISFMIKNIKKLSKPRKARTPLAQFHSKSFQIPTPFGVVLVMSPWNYPFFTCDGSASLGNC